MELLHTGDRTGQWTIFYRICLLFLLVVDVDGGGGGFALFINLRQKTENKTTARRKPELSPSLHRLNKEYTVSQSVL